MCGHFCRIQKIREGLILGNGGGEETLWYLSLISGEDDLVLSRERTPMMTEVTSVAYR